MSKSKQISSSCKCKPEGFWSEVLSEHVRLTIKTSNAMRINSLAMKLDPAVERATVLQYTRTTVHINYLHDTGGKRRQRDSACLGVLLPFSHQQVAIDFILDPAIEVTLFVKGPHQVTVFGQFLPADTSEGAAVAGDATFTRVSQEGIGRGSSSGPGKSTASSSRFQFSKSRSVSRAPSTSSVDQHAGGSAFSPAASGSGRRPSFDSVSSNSYHDAPDNHDNWKPGGSVGPVDKKLKRS